DSLATIQAKISVCQAYAAEIAGTCSESSCRDSSSFQKYLDVFTSMGEDISSLREQFGVGTALLFRYVDKGKDVETPDSALLGTNGSEGPKPDTQSDDDDPRDADHVIHDCNVDYISLDVPEMIFEGETSQPEARQRSK
ncbi:hypothetical protein EV182_008574, partial [Spiromyces aspiralis]